MFSRGSQSRLRAKFAQIDQRRIVNRFLVTLTCQPVAWPVFRRMFRLYMAAMARAVPGQWFAVWRLEPHLSGRPHVHLVMYWRERSPDVRRMRAASDAAWRRQVERAGREWHGNGSSVSYVGKDGRAEGYTCKAESYVSKRGDGSEHDGEGRFWGVVRGKFMPVDVADVRLTGAQMTAYQRLLRRYAARSSRCLVVTPPAPSGASAPPPVFFRAVDGVPSWATRKVLRRNGFRTRWAGKTFLRHHRPMIWGHEVGKANRIFPIAARPETEAACSYAVPWGVSLRLLGLIVGADVQGDAVGPFAGSVYECAVDVASESSAVGSAGPPEVRVRQGRS